MREHFKNQFDRIREAKTLKPMSDRPLKRRKFPQTTWFAMAIIIVAAIIYTSPQYEVADERMIEIPARSFHGYPVTVSSKNMIGVEIENLSGQAFDFYILPTAEFELLKQYIVNGKDPNREVQYIYREQGVKKIKLEHFTLNVGDYTLVMDNTYFDSDEDGASEKPLVLGFKVLRKTGGIF